MTNDKSIISSFKFAIAFWHRPSVIWHRSSVIWHRPVCLSAHTQRQGILDAQVLVDPPGRVRAVQGVEVEAADVVVEQVAALLGRPVDADLGDGLGIVAAPLDAAEQSSGEPRP